MCRKITNKFSNVQKNGTNNLKAPESAYAECAYVSPPSTDK